MLSPRRCEHTFRTCPSQLYPLLLPPTQTRIRFRVTHPILVRPTRDLGHDRGHLVGSLTGAVRLLGLLSGGAADAHTARRGQDPTQGLCLQEDVDVASLTLRAPLVEVGGILVRAAHDLRRLVVDVVEHAAIHTRLAAGHALLLHAKLVAEEILTPQKVGHPHRLLVTGEVDRVIRKIDPLLP